jgi:hypothetical protein
MNDGGEEGDDENVPEVPDQPLEAPPGLVPQGRQRIDLRVIPGLFDRCPSAGPQALHVRLSG